MANSIGEWLMAQKYTKPVVGIDGNYGEWDFLVAWQDEGTFHY